MTGTDRYYAVGCYIPPFHLAWTTIATIKQVMAEMPKGCTPLIVGDLNVDLDNPRDDRDEVVAEAMDALDVSCLTRHFGQRRGRLIRGRWTWRQRRRNRYISSKPDYFLTGAKG